MLSLICVEGKTSRLATFDPWVASASRQEKTTTNLVGNGVSVGSALSSHAHD